MSVTHRELSLEVGLLGHELVELVLEVTAAALLHLELHQQVVLLLGQLGVLSLQLLPQLLLLLEGLLGLGCLLFQGLITKHHNRLCYTLSQKVFRPYN
jgi:hypothetical protein